MPLPDFPRPCVLTVHKAFERLDVERANIAIALERFPEEPSNSLYYGPGMRHALRLETELDCYAMLFQCSRDQLRAHTLRYLTELGWFKSAEPAKSAATP